MNDIEVKSPPFTFLIPTFSAETKTLTAKSGAKAYSQPTVSSTVVYTFPQSGTYYIDYLLFCESDYWIRMKNLGSSKVTGYAKCSEVGFNFSAFVAPSAQKPNSSLGTNPNPTFNMLYFPNGEYKGVNYPTPLYYQLYYVIGKPDLVNSQKCTLLSQIAGYYAYNKTAQHPENYLGSMTPKYWNDKDGMLVWLAKMSRTSTQASIMAKAKSNLNLNKPFLVGAQARDSEITPHMVLVTGYKNSGTNLSDYIVLDSSQKYFSNLDAFFKSFPDQPIKFNIGGTGYVYGEY